MKLSSPAHAAGFAALLAVFGVSTIWPAAAFLWNLWITEPLKSIGMLVPLISLVLILRVWRSLGWEMEGSWWGLAILVFAIAAIRLREQAVLLFVVSPQWTVYIPPASLIVLAYGAGVVLLFGGIRLFRAALFPILLLWLVNPVPHVFSVLVDLPLQRASAHVARAFAHALGQPLTPDQMRLMFTPTFGMFIAPGCNGIRGAVTMGFIALIAGYIYRFRWRAHALVVTGAVLLGYVFNFARLCTLVIYYIIALRIPWLRSRAEMGDYIIGACLFLIASMLLFYVTRRLGESPAQVSPVAEAPVAAVAPSSSLPLRFAVMTLLAAFGCYNVARARILDRPQDQMAISLSPDQPGASPKLIGSYTLVRTWNENLTKGVLLYHWAEYAPLGGGTHISIGISPVLGSHDTLICHSSRGEDALWRDQLTLTTAPDKSSSFSASFYNEATQFLEVSTICNGHACSEYTDDRRHFGFVYSKPDPYALISSDPQRPIPVLLKAEIVDTSMPSDLARKQLMDSVGAFLASADLDALTQPYRR